MAALKTEWTKAVEQNECPTCQAQKDEHCVNRKDGRRAALHKARVELICGETFLGMPQLVQGWAMFCSRPANHRAARHRTPDGRLDWAKGFGEDVVLPVSA